MTITKTIITKIIITIMMRMRIKIGTCKSIQVKATHISLKGRNVQKAIFYWSAKITCCRWLSLSLKKKEKVGYIIPTMNCYPRNGENNIFEIIFEKLTYLHSGKRHLSKNGGLLLVQNLHLRIAFYLWQN